LLRAAPVAAVASDAHGPERSPSLRLALDTLTGLGLPSPRRFIAEVPQALLQRGLPARPGALAA
jgi:hypothetical protein